MGATKEDMDRVGLFKEMEYVTIKDPYQDPSKCKCDWRLFFVK